MKRITLVLILALGFSGAFAQNNFNMPPPAGVTVGGYQVVATCGTGSLSTSTPAFGTVNTAGQFCVNASVSASITGFPGTSQTTGTPIAVTTGGVTGTLPAGAVVVASNVGATNGAYCKLGASATTNDQLIPPNSWFAFTVGSNTQLTCITSTSTTTVNMVGGSGLPTGSGGGGGGAGGGGAVTVADGADVTQGAKADSVCGTSTGTCTIAALIKYLNTQAATTATNTAAPIPTQAVTVPIGGVTNDPCQYATKTRFTFTTSTQIAQLVAPSGSTQVYICSLVTVGDVATKQSIIAGTGSVCTTANEEALIGSTTAASGLSFAANGGFAFGAGAGTVTRTVTGGNGVCMQQSGSGLVAGGGTFVQQ